MGIKGAEDAAEAGKTVIKNSIGGIEIPYEDINPIIKQKTNDKWPNTTENGLRKVKDAPVIKHIRNVQK